MTLGSQTVGFVAVYRGAEGRFEHGKDRAQTDVSGGLFRPLPGSETVTETDVIVETWKWTGPPDDAAVNARATGEIVYDGSSSPVRGTNDVNVFQITSVEPHSDFSGRIHHVVVICQRQTS